MFYPGCQSTTKWTLSHLATVLFLTITSQLLFQAQAYLITVEEGAAEECFHEKVPIGTKLGFSFEVVEGGFYDIDVQIKDPANVIVHQEERASNGKFTMESNLDGPYQFCFSNKRTSFSPKVIIFDIDKAEPNAKGPADSTETSSGTDGDDSETGKISLMINQLMMSTISARHDVRYLTARDRVHRKVNERTNSTIVWWSGIEFLMLLGVTVGQVLYLKRFFEVRRQA